MTVQSPRYVPADSGAGSLDRFDDRGLTRWRRWITWAFAAIWLVDAHLQFQQFMFTAGKHGFPQTQIAPTGQGNPGFVSGPVAWAVRLMDSDIGLWNLLFAVSQLAIGLALIWRRTLRLGLLASMAWALSLWWMGEGLGGILAGPVSPLMGLPGAAILYVIISILVWPRTRRVSASVATSGPAPAWVARTLWAALWLLSAWESLRAANRAPSALRDMVIGMESGEPGWLKRIDSFGGDLLGHRGLTFAIVLAAACVLIAAAPLFESSLSSITRAGLILAVLVSLLIWVFGEDLGGIATGHATDPNTGPLLILLALTFWPLRRATAPGSGDASPHPSVQTSRPS